MQKIFNVLLVCLVMLTACKKTKLAGDDITGEGLVGFNLRTPTSGTSLVLNSATPNTPIEITWTASAPGLTTLPTYKWIAAPKTGGSLESPLLSIPANNSGKDTKLTLTYKQVDDALKAAGVLDGARIDLTWTIQATNGSATINATDIFNISITRFQDGASPFVLLGPASSLTPFAIDPGSATNFITFNWTKSIPAKAANIVKYKVLFVERKLDANGNEITPDFSLPLFSINSNSSAVDSFARISYKQISDSLTAKGFTNLGVPSSLLWTVVATSGTWNQKADYVNRLMLLREVRMYLPGSYQGSTGNGTDWTPGNAPELLRDLRPGLTNNMYYIYIYLPANAEFKVTEGRAWDVNYGGSGGNLTLNGGNNFSVTSAGVYRISFNRTTLKYDIRAGRMGFVGGATAAGWNPPNVFPNSAMSFIGNNRFIGIGNFTVDGWKLIDNNSWNSGSNTVDETRSYGSAGPAGSLLEVNGPNMPDITTAGAYRVIWNGSDVNGIKYDFNSAAEMRVVGDGIFGVADWTPAVSPQMTYQGNGKWQIIRRMNPGKNFKFLAGNAWGAFDYEDAGSGKIRWDGNDNMTVPASFNAALNCTIVLDEYTQTWTITQ